MDRKYHPRAERRAVPPVVARACAAALVALLLVARAPEIRAQATPSRVEPIFPRENPNLVFVEGEDAVSTNFSSQPTLSYSASGKRTLQLSSTAEVQGEEGYYADYVFYVSASADYELWYAGTPAGPLDEIYPSYSSPFRYRVDGHDPMAVYREDIVVNEGYAPAFYWNKVGAVTLEQGVHRLRFEVSEKRRHDGRYYFYLDCFFLVRTAAGKPVPGEPLPELFPRDLAGTAMDRPFRSIDDYLVIVEQATERAEKVRRQVELATVYSMVGDYANALRYLSLAAVLDPDEPEILLLQAKNQIWKGDLGQGLATYRRLLELTPERADLWVEAGKIAAWSGRYDDSVGIFKAALARHPGDLDLMVNLGLTYLWASRASEAELMFRASLQAAGGDLAEIKHLASVYRVNGYAEKAIPLYRASIASSRADLESYLLLESSLRSLRRPSEADEVARTIKDTFVSSPDLERYLGIFQIKQGLVQTTIDEYRAALAATPDNLSLRQLLAQTYFWNGFRQEAIQEYRSILLNHAYRQLKELESSSTDLLGALDLSYALARYGATAQEVSRALRGELDARRKEAASALAAFRAAEGAAGKEAEGGDSSEAADAALAQSTRLAGSTLRQAEELIGRLELAVELYRRWKVEVATLEEAGKEAERLFADETRASRWRWNRAGTLADAASQAGLSIAQYVLAKVAELERRFGPAEQAYARLAEEDPDRLYGSGQTRFWAGKLALGQYVELLRGLPASVVPYAAELADGVTRLGLATPPGGAQGEADEARVSADEVAAGLDAAAARIGELLSEVERDRRELPQEQRTAHRLLQERMVRTFYSYEQRTARLRNELGDYYLEAGDRASAIEQFRYALAVDPSNIDATFRLGTTSSLAGDWSGALAFYERVWTADPAYGNVINAYNRIAEEHADTLHVTGSYVADPAHISWTGSVRYTLPLRSSLGVELTYDVGSYVSAEPLVNLAYDPVSPVTHHIASLRQSVALAAPINLYRAGVTLAPRFGAEVVLKSQYFTGDPGNGSSTHAADDLFVLAPGQSIFGPEDFLAAHTVYPFAGLGVDVERASAFRAQGSIRYGTYAQTLAEPKSPRSALEASLGLSPVLSFLSVPVLRDVYLRSYGEIAYLPATAASAANAVGQIAQDLVIPLHFSSPSQPSLSIEGSLYWADSLASGFVYDYYSPHSSLTVKGGLSGSLSPAVGADRLSLTARVTGGYASSKDALGTETKLALVEGSVGVSYSRRGTVTAFRTAFSAALDPEDRSLSYWSLQAAVEVTTRAARLLAPR